MIDRVEDRCGMKPKRLIGDTAYGTADFLGWLGHRLINRIQILAEASFTRAR
jgi:hypothetical protein